MSLNQHNDGSESLKNTLECEKSDGDLPSTSEATPSMEPQSLFVKKSGKDGEKRRVTFPEDDSKLITGYMEPANPWQSVGEISGSELINEYTASCRKHNTEPQQAVLDQLKEYVFLGASRCGVLSISSAPLLPAQCEALEAVLRRARFNRIEACNAALTDETAIALFDMLEYYESASELDISYNTGFGIHGWQACSKMVNKSQCLEQLEARGTSLSENTAPVLGRGLRSPCALRVLHLQRAGLKGRPMLCLANALKQNKSVRELHIGDNSLVSEDAIHLASLLRSNTFLQLLDISNNDIQDLGVERIADALSEQSTPSPSPSTSTSTSSSSAGDSTTSSPQSTNSASYQERGLAVLVMWNNNLTRNSGHHLSKALARCKSLEVLNIGQNPLGGETINRVKVALQQNRSLLCLGVQGARLGAEAGVALAEVIEDNHCIQRIDLRDNKLKAAGLLALATALKKNDALTRLDLDDALPSHNNGVEQPLEETRLVDEIRTLCRRNEVQQTQQQSTPSTPTSEENLHRRRVASFSTRKISLTCQTLHRTYEPISEPALSPPKMSSGRLRSPLPSPTPSPASSPIPSPSHRSRFIVSRVSDSSSVNSESSSPSTPPSARNYFSNPRFKVVSVPEPPKINVTLAPEEMKCFSGLEEHTVSKQINMDLNSNVHDDALAKSDLTSNQEESNEDKMKSNTDVSDMGQGDIAIKQHNESTTECIETKGHMEDDGVSDNPCFTTAIIIDNQLQRNEEVYQGPPSIKKNKSESSLDSPDLEVSRLMLKKEAYDSSSSLDISGSSMESLNNIESNANNNHLVMTTATTTAAAAVATATATAQIIPRNESIPLSTQDETEDVFPINDYKNPFIYSVSEGNPSRKKLSASSNESSLESSTFETGVTVTFPHHGGHQSNLLNSSVSSNESVSPNIFGKHIKLHGSVTSLEASVSSLDSYKSKNDFISPQNPNAFSFPTSENSQLAESVDSGISTQSDTKGRTPSFNESFSSNEGTLTSSSNLKSSIFSMGGDSSLSIEEDNEKSSTGEAPVGHQLLSEVTPRRVTSLLDVPSMQKSPRMRKISWVAPTSQQSQLTQQPDKKDDDQLQQVASTSTKVPSSLEKLLSIFQHPGSFFSRSDAVEKKSNDSSQSSSRRDSQTSMNSSGSFWPWNLSSASLAGNTSKVDKAAPIGAIERLKKYGESFETALQFNSDSEKKTDLHSSKSDTYLETKDSENTLTSDIVDRLKDPLFARTKNFKRPVNFDNNPDFQYSNSPPVYSVGSEYFKQTLATCIIHPFQNPNVSADFTLKLFETKTECTCRPSEDSELDIDDPPIPNINYVGDDNDSCEDVCKQFEPGSMCQSPVQYMDSVEYSSDIERISDNLSGECVNPINTDTKDSVIETSDLNVNMGALSISNIVTNNKQYMDSVEYSSDIERISDNLSGECVNPINTDTKDSVIETSDLNVNMGALSISNIVTNNKQLPETLSYEMGSVFKFHDVCEEYKDSDNSRTDSVTVVESSAAVISNAVNIVDSTNEKVKGDERLVRHLTESERQNISEIVKNVCEEAVKTVAATTKRMDASNICDRVTPSQIIVRVVSNNDKSPNTSSYTGDSGFTVGDSDKDSLLDGGANKVQNVERFDCDNNSILANNQGCLCDYNNYNCINRCKYVDSRLLVIVNKNCNNTVDLNAQGLSQECESISQILPLPQNDSVTCNSNNKCSNVSSGDSVISAVNTIDTLDILSQRSLPHPTPTQSDNCALTMSTISTISDDSKVDKMNNANTWIRVPDVDLYSENVDSNKIPLGIYYDGEEKAISEAFKKDINLELTHKELTRPTELSVRNTPPKQISMILKQSIGLDNKTILSERQLSPESGPSVSNLPSKIIRRIKENVSPENTLTSSMSNTKALAQELMERKKILGANEALWEISLKDNVEKILDDRNVNQVDELLVELLNKLDDKIKISSPKEQKSNEVLICDHISEDADSCLSISTKCDETSSLCDVDQGSDALTVLEMFSDEASTVAEEANGVDSIVLSALDDDEMGGDISLPVDVMNTSDPNSQYYDGNTSELDNEHRIGVESRFAGADLEISGDVNIESIAIDVACEAITDQFNPLTEISETGDLFHETSSSDFKPISILKKATPSISKTVSLPQDIPEATKPFPYYGFTLSTPASCSLPMRCGSLPENTSSTLSGDETLDTLSLIQSRCSANPTSPVQNKLGKMARDSLYALNMSEDEIKEYRSSARLSSMDSVRSLGSLSEDLEGLSSSSYVFQSSSDRDSLLEQGASQDSLVSLESISENASESGNMVARHNTYDSG